MRNQPPACLLCPRAIATTGLTGVKGYVISPITVTPAGVNTKLNWTSNGCEYSLPPGSSLGPYAGGSGLWIMPSVPWEPIGPGGGTGYTHLNTSSYSGSWGYTVVPQIP